MYIEKAEDETEEQNEEERDNKTGRGQEKRRRLKRL